MRKKNPFQIAFITICAIILIVLSFQMVECKTYAVNVVSVYDGDTLRLSFENDFQFDARLHGIDAPELTQDFGTQCRTTLVNLVAGQTLKVWIISEDRYNRKLVKLFRPDYTEVNYDMIVAGCAWLYSPRKSEKEKYYAAFSAAYLSHAGLFSQTRFCQPSKWRRGTCVE